MTMSSRLSLLLVTALLAACAGKSAPDWQLNAGDALERGTAAALQGKTRVAEQEFTLARQEVARTGRIELMARVELTRCATDVASLVLADECAGFARLRDDAPQAERVYADFLAGRLQAQDAAQLPVQYRNVATSTSDAAAASAMSAIDDPVSRLVAAGVLFRSNRATPAVLQSAVDTSSQQGWQRPLLAWLDVQARRAEQAGAADEASKIRRRIQLIQHPNKP